MREKEDLHKEQASIHPTHKPHRRAGEDKGRGMIHSLSVSCLKEPTIMEDGVCTRQRAREESLSCSSKGVEVARARTTAYAGRRKLRVSRIKKQAIRHGEERRKLRSQCVHVGSPSRELSVRSMGVDDLAGVFHMGERIFTHELGNLYRFWDTFEVTAMFQSDSDYCFVAVVGEILAGFLLGTIVEKSQTKYGYVVWLGVSPGHQGQGVGKALFERFRSVCGQEEVSSFFADTQKDNKPAANFFEKQGFIAAEEHIYVSLNTSKANNEIRHGSRARRRNDRTRMRTTGVTIREMEIDDISQVFHMGESLFRARRAMTTLYRQWDEFEVTSLHMEDTEVCLVAEKDERVIGFVLGSIIQKHAWTYCYCVWIGVDAPYQRHLVGTRLMEEFRERAEEQGTRIMLADMHMENEPAIAFFTAMGFGNAVPHVFFFLN